VTGNVWFREGSRFYCSGGLLARGGAHCFLRNDAGDRISQYYKQDKPGGSVEMIGHVTTLDEFHILNGDLIVAEDNRVEPGRNAHPIVEKEAKLVLLDGAYFGKWINDLKIIDMMLKGTIQGGTPERPLTRDCTLGLGFQNWTGAELGQSKWEGKGGQKSRSIRSKLARKVSMVCQRGSAIRAHRARGSDASIVVRWHGFEKSYGFDLLGKEKEHNVRIPRNITVYLDEDTMADGVKFDHLHKGGLMFKDQATRARWRNVSFGEHCDGRPDELFRHYPQGIDTKRGTY
jgi:hypothetical protein